MEDGSNAALLEAMRKAKQEYCSLVNELNCINGYQYDRS